MNYISKTFLGSLSCIKIRAATAFSATELTKSMRATQCWRFAAQVKHPEELKTKHRVSVSKYFPCICYFLPDSTLFWEVGAACGRVHPAHLAWAPQSPRGEFKQSGIRQSLPSYFLQFPLKITARPSAGQSHSTQLFGTHYLMGAARNQHRHQ